MRSIKLLSIISFLFLFTTLSSCSYNVSGLPETNNDNCGNGVIDDGEDCEPYINISETCIDLGYSSGNIACNLDCTFDTSSCFNNCGDCQIGTQECQSNKIYTCTEDSSGCGTLTETEDCDANQLFCTAESGVATCESNCSSNCDTLGNQRCNSGGVEVCSPSTTDASCLQWEPLINCESGEICQYLPANETASCVPDCTIGDLECNSDNSDIIICGTNENGFTEWITQETCDATNSTTSGPSGVCINPGSSDPYCQECTDCVAGEEVCSADFLSVTSCNTDPTGTCNFWKTTDTCAQGFWCSTIDATTAECGDCVVCPLGNTRCPSDLSTIETCESTNNGCTDWAVSNCSNGTVCESVDLANATCNSCDICTLHDTRCSDDLLGIETCDSTNYGCTYWTPSFTCNQNSSEQCDYTVTPPSNPTCVSTGFDCASPYRINSLPFEYTTNDFNQFSNEVDFTCLPKTGNDGSDNGKDLFFEVYLQAGKTIMFKEDGGMDSMLRILSTTDSCNNYNCLAGRDTSLSEAMVYEVTADGTYIFVVEAYNENIGTGTQDDAHIQIYEVSLLCTEHETEDATTQGLNDSFSTSDPAINSNPRIYCQHFATGADHDCVKVDVSSPGGNIDFSTHSAYDTQSCSRGTYLAVFDSDGQMVMYDENSGVLYCSLLNPTIDNLADHLPADTYTVCVDSQDHYYNPELMSIDMNILPTGKTIILSETFKNNIPAGWAQSGWDTGSGDGAFAINHYGHTVSGNTETTTNDLYTPALNMSGYTHVYLRILEGTSFSQSGGGNDIFGRIYLTNGTSSRTIDTDFSSRNAWTVREFDITDAVTALGGTNLQVRFMYKDERYAVGGYWNIDNVLIYGE